MGMRIVSHGYHWAIDGMSPEQAILNVASLLLQLIYRKRQTNS